MLEAILSPAITNFYFKLQYNSYVCRKNIICNGHHVQLGLNNFNMDKGKTAVVADIS